MAADDLLAETDDERLVAYLRMFRLRPFPRAIDRLLELARSENDRVAVGALVALSKIQDERVRALGLDLMAEAKCGYAVDLLTHNSQGGDYRIIERLLQKQSEADDYHRLGQGVRDFVRHTVPKRPSAHSCCYTKMAHARSAATESSKN